MRIDILTIFPRMFETVFEAGMVGQGIRGKLLSVRAVDLREFTTDRHRTADDRPYGGGEGMVLKPEPIFRAVDACRADNATPWIVLLSPQGVRFDQGVAQRLSSLDHLVLICGRYEGVDQRVADHLANEEISIGDFVLSGGEFAAMVVVDALARLIPGVVGNASSILEDSFMHGLLDYPQYTRPAEFRGLKVPEVLLSGDHEKIRRWRESAALHRTRRHRPDLMRDDEDASPAVPTKGPREWPNPR